MRARTATIGKDGEHKGHFLPISVLRQEDQQQRRRKRVGRLIDAYLDRPVYGGEEYQALVAALRESGPVEWDGVVWMWSQGDGSIIRLR